MQFIRQPKPLDIAERVLPELVPDWINTKSVQMMNIGMIQKLQVEMLIIWVIKFSDSWMPHRCTFKTNAHQVCAIWG